MIEIIKERLEKLTVSDDPKKPKAVSMFYNGKMLKMRNRKSVWKQVGHAKLALRNELYNIRYDFPYDEREKLWENIYNLVEFREIY